VKINAYQWRQIQIYAVQQLGFMDVSIAKAELMEPEARRLEAWLNQGHHAKMSYLENHFDLRVDPRKLVEGAKSVISLSYNYYNDQVEQPADAPKIAMYAYGKDYHKLIRKKLKHLLDWIEESMGEVNGRGFVDSAPILERDWAKRSGMGWIGKHTLLISKRRGSYFFLAELISDLEYEDDIHIESDHCGTCTRCIDACPTDAISPAGYVLDATKCISYLTIELKESMPEEYQDQLESWMFGCDICQQVCPWNRFSSNHNEPKFLPSTSLMSKNRKDWQDLEEPEFELLFAGSAVRRAGFLKLKDNIEAVIRSDSEE